MERMRGPRVGGDPTFKLFTNKRLDRLRKLLDTGNLSKKDRGSVEKEILTIIRDQDMESLGFKEGGSVKKNLTVKADGSAGSSREALGSSRRLQRLWESPGGSGKPGPKRFPTEDGMLDPKSSR